MVKKQTLVFLLLGFYSYGFAAEIDFSLEKKLDNDHFMVEKINPLAIGFEKIKIENIEQVQEIFIKVKEEAQKDSCNKIWYVSDIDEVIINSLKNPRILVEGKRTKHFLDHIYHEADVFIGLTARYSKYARRTIKELKFYGIDFHNEGPSSFIDATGEQSNFASKAYLDSLIKQEVISYKGVIFASATHKGTALFHYLKRLEEEHWPTHLIFIDDRSENIIDVEQLLIGDYYLANKEEAELLKKIKMALLFHYTHAYIFEEEYYDDYDDEEDDGGLVLDLSKKIVKNKAT